MKPTVAATLHLLPTEVSWRRSPIRNGYRPAFKFSSVEGHWVGSNFVMNPDPLAPGGEATIKFQLISMEELAPSLKVGTKFEIYEGWNLQGEGVITGFEDTPYVIPGDS